MAVFSRTPASFEWCPCECSGHILRTHSGFSWPDDFMSINPGWRNREHRAGTKGADHACLRMGKSNLQRSGWTLLFPLKVEQCTITGPVALWRLIAGLDRFNQSVESLCGGTPSNLYTYRCVPAIKFSSFFGKPSLIEVRDGHIFGVQCLNAQIFTAEHFKCLCNVPFCCHSEDLISAPRPSPPSLPLPTSPCLQTHSVP